MVQMFLDRGAHINAQDKDGCRALHLAAANGHIGILDCLITHGAKTTLCDTQMKSVLHHSICSQIFENGIETVRWLLAHQIASEDADVDNMTPLHLAVKSNRDDIAGLLLHHSYLVDIGVERKFWLRCLRMDLIVIIWKTQPKKMEDEMLPDSLLCTLRHFLAVQKWWAFYLTMERIQMPSIENMEHLYT